MPKIDWNAIEGYNENLSAEEKLALLEKDDSSPAPAPNTPEGNAPQPKPETKVIAKAQFDKVASELAAAKKQLRAKMTEDELRETERQQEQEAIRTELENLRREKTLSGYKASCLALNYDEATADEMAHALADGDMETVFDVMKRQNVTIEKSLRAKILKETPVPPAGNDPNNDAKKLKEMADLRASFGLPPL